MKAPPKPPPPKKRQAGKAPTAVTKAKTFGIGKWTGAGEGEKIILYGMSGIGKTTLGALAPGAVFIGLDDGGRKIRHPETGEPISVVEGVKTFDDFRSAIAQRDLFKDYETVVIDTGTMLESLASDWTVANIPHEKGQRVNRLVEYGYGKGYEHLYDTMRMAFTDLNGLARTGKHVLILCQQCPVVVANTSGANYMSDGPKLYHPGPDSKQTFSIRLFACEWADHVFRLDYINRKIEDKKATGDTERAVFITPEDASYCAKSRTLGNLRDEDDGRPITRVTFKSPADDMIWQWLFAK